jgi:hypothetical protein
MKLMEHRSRNLPLPSTGQSLTFCDEVKGLGSAARGGRSYIVQLRHNCRKLR